MHLSCAMHSSINHQLYQKADLSSLTNGTSSHVFLEDEHKYPYSELFLLVVTTSAVLAGARNFVCISLERCILLNHQLYQKTDLSSLTIGTTSHIFLEDEYKYPYSELFLLVVTTSAVLAGARNFVCISLERCVLLNHQLSLQTDLSSLTIGTSSHIFLEDELINIHI